MKPQSSGADLLPLALTQGDPAGVGPLITIQAWQTLKSSGAGPFYVRASADCLRQTSVRSGLGCPITEITSPDQAASVFPTGIPVINADCPKCVPGKPDPETSSSIVRSISDCVADVWSGKAAAVVTNPISKSVLKAGGFKHPGHTEYLAELAGQHMGKQAPRPIMMLVGGGLRVALATIHMPLISVPGALSEALIVEIGETVSLSLQQDFGLKDPKLGICGLNPHAGEDGMLGSEEKDMIRPAIERLISKGITAMGPRPGDTVFHEALRGNYDAVLAMYHDQGLIPVKTLDMWGGVNVTLGLPFIRTSPDHGTAYDAAETGSARADSLIAAMQLARDMAGHRSSYKADQ